MPANVYALESCFDRKALQTPAGRRKAHLFAALVPAGCRSILDAGGGTGWSTIGLQDRCDIVTLDSTAESLFYAPGCKVQATVEKLPFCDNSFDLVLSSQVLEHLPDEPLRAAVAEMARVAKRFLLVSVPYREALEARYVRCKHCGHAFHPDYHCRSFGERDLAALFPGWVMSEWHVFGELSWAVGVDPQVFPRAPGPRAHLRFAPSTTYCPSCGLMGDDRNSSPAEPTRSFMTRVYEGARYRVNSMLKRKPGPRFPTFLPQGVAPYWIACLFAREGEAPVDSFARQRGLDA